jgi:hippurate hydrolase
MAILRDIEGFHEDLTAWRRDLHANPELGFEEKRTSDLVAKRLAEMGIEVHRGLGGTGVVGSIRAGAGPSIGLRADMDALPLHETNGFAHRSRHDGRMHACGHDGHMAMLLGAARYLAATRNFSGTVNFFFQPAEEGLGGAKAMIDDGLFAQFPVDSVYGMHNFPRLRAGNFMIRPGPMMAAAAGFELLVRGRGGHAARPEATVDPILTAAHMVTALQSIVSRNVSPQDTAVVSITRLQGGTAHNVIPEEATIWGNVRSFRPEVTDLIEAAVGRIAKGAAAQFGAEVEMKFRRVYPPLINHARETDIAADIAADVVGEERVLRNGIAVMASEDFSYMLQERPGAYIFIGNGEGEGSCEVHNPGYDFNDAIIPTGASYFARLVELNLPKTN